MRKILIVWDVKSRGSPATLFYRALRGHDYTTKAGRSHSPGILDKLPKEFIHQSTLLIEEEYTKPVEKILNSSRSTWIGADLRW